MAEATVTSPAATIEDALGLRADVADDASMAEAFGAVTQAWGGLDVLVNNAGIAQQGAPAMDIEAAQIDRIFAVNVRGVFHSTRYALASLQDSQSTILNIASNAGLRPRPGAARRGTTRARRR